MDKHDLSPTPPGAAHKSLKRALRTLHAQHLKKPYTTFRSLRDMADAFDDQQFCDANNSFIQTLLALGPDDTMLDVGAGQGVMAQQYLADAELPFDRSLECPPIAERARAILVDISRPPQVANWESNANSEVLGKYSYIESYFEAVETGRRIGAGTVRMMMDYYGGASYTLRLAEYFDQLLHVLRPGGEVFLVFNGVTDECSRREVMERVQDRVVSLDDEIRNHRMDALGRKKVRGQDAANLHNTLVLRRDGTVVFLEEWLCELEAFDARRFSPAKDFYIPIMLRRKPRTTTLPRLEFVEANLATPPYRLFQEVHHRRAEP